MFSAVSLTEATLAGVKARLAFVAAEGTRAGACWTKAVALGAKAPRAARASIADETTRMIEVGFGQFVGGCQ